ncbi:MAG TPA: hypothetical protein IGS37_17265 [Synechococcales cyanobacterium M55_K2018_004]|nr:hypothetical protein [Synechococcales cyanobacterium M55_K2018_004]
MTSADASLEQSLTRLRNFRLALLRLHKALLDSERGIYEQFHGRIRSNTEFFQLVIQDDGWFSWLRPMSQFIVQIDDVLHAKEPVTQQQVEDLLNQAEVLIQPAEFGTPMEKGYFRAIQRDPDIALMHADMMQILVGDR